MVGTAASPSIKTLSGISPGQHDHHADQVLLLAPSLVLPKVGQQQQGCGVNRIIELSWKGLLKAMWSKSSAMNGANLLEGQSLYPCCPQGCGSGCVCSLSRLPSSCFFFEC